MTICNLKIHTPEYITSAIRVTMIKLAAFGLLGFLVLLILPANAAEQTPTSFLYGAATLVAYDAYGNEIFAQTVHNQLYDQGEDFILDQTFTDEGGVAVLDNIQIGAICLSAAAFVADETDIFSDFNTAHDAADNAGAIVSTNCVTDTIVPSVAQIITIGPLTFTASATDSADWYADDTVIQIGVCDADGGGASVRGCTTTLFAVVNTSDVTLADTETVDVTYTFDISDNSS